MTVGAKEADIIAVPVIEGVKFTLQLAVPNITGEGAHVPWLSGKVPVAVPVAEKTTTPVGVKAVPAVEVSITVAVQEDAVPTVTGVSQVTVVEVARRLTVIVAETVDELPLWVVSVALGA